MKYNKTHDSIHGTPDKLVLAYSGGLDTSIAIPWLREHYGVEVHAICGDVGQGADELVGLEEKAMASGAASVRVVDLREQFVTQCIWPALGALATYEGRYLLGTSLARPVLAEAQVRFAQEIGARYVAHGCTGKGNDQVRFELAFMALAPELEIVAPWREWEIESREDAIQYAHKAGIPITASLAKIYSRDRNLWHISHEGGVLEEPGQAPPEDVWTWTADPKHAPEHAVQLTIDFEAAIPVGIGGVRLGPVVLLEQLNAAGAAAGVGRVDIVENRMVGMKSRGVYETPGGTILYEAMRSLRALTMERDLARTCERMALDYSDVIYTGRWFHPLRESFAAFFTEANKHVSGSVTVELHKGKVTALCASAPKSLYSDDLATFGASTGYDQMDSAGYVRLYGLPGQVAAQVQGVQTCLDPETCGVA